MARVIWPVVAVPALVLFIASVPVRYHLLSNPPGTQRAALEALSIPVEAHAGYLLSLELLFALVFVLVASIIYFRKARDMAALLFSLMLLMVGTASIPILPTMEALGHAQPALVPVIRTMTFIAWALVFLFFCTFPDGRFVPKWSRWFAAFAILISIPWNIFPDSALSPWTWPRPLLVGFEIAIWGTCVFIQVYRYWRVSNSVERQQTRWVVFGMVVSVAGIVGLYLPRAVNPDLAHPPDRYSLTYYLLSSTAVTVSALFTPVAIGISILRYRLWAIDLIINRALVYIPLTAILGGLYTASIAFFQRVFIALTGDTSDAAIVISSLIIASVFTPIRNSLQSAVDRRFKERPEPSKRLEQFGEQVHSVVEIFEPRVLAKHLLDEAMQAFNAKGGAVYLARPRRGHHPDYRDLRLAYQSDGWQGHARISMTLRRHGDGPLYGVLVLGPRGDGREYTAEDRRKLREVVDVVSEALSLGS
jgi:hypothetical protein